MEQLKSGIYTIPAGVAFARSLSAYMLEKAKDQPELLSETRVLLPTRRACRVLQEAFAAHHSEGGLLLPRMQPLGDVDEEELSLSIAGLSGTDRPDLSLPPALSSLRRQVLLARLILARGDFNQGVDQALALAKALGHLMDQIYTENLDMADLVNLVPEEFSDHWQITLKFLEILSIEWPKILAEQGVIDAADRRNRLILALCEYWSANPPETPVIVAGTTGSIPATAQLLKTVLSMPKGVVVLPGLDQDMDPESWDSLDETHPQFGIKQILGRLGVSRHDVDIVPGCEPPDDLHPRYVVAREMMRPAETSGRWAELSRVDIEGAFDGVSSYICDNETHEAGVIALALRQVLEESEKTGCFITPDRLLARRVTTALRRWGVEIDDSAGRSLLQTSLGSYLLLLPRVCIGNAAPKDVLALCHHSLARFGLSPQDKTTGLSALDESLRGAKPAAGFEGLRGFVEERERISETVRTRALSFLDVLEEKLSDFCARYGYSGASFSFLSLVQAHLQIAESISAYEGQDGCEALWGGVDGQAASSFFADILQQLSVMPEVNLEEYEGALTLFMRDVTLRPAYGTHPRLQILGQLEARMVDADLVVLGGLNEGTWPPDAGADPWMSRPMRKDFGLPGLERSIGLAAHDFVQGFCARRVVMTRAKRSGSAPSVPSRWLQRLDAVMQAADIQGDDVFEAPDVLQWARDLDATEEFSPVQRPAPTPPASARPRRLPVTQIETWLRDPYSVYAKYVLNLKKLDEVEQSVDAALRGTMLHSILDRFVQENPDEMPEDAVQILHEFAREEIKGSHEEESVWSFWWPRFSKIACWYEGQEREHRQYARPLKTEVKGQMSFAAEAGDFVLHGTADRIDKVRASGDAIVLDYKSGGTFSPARMMAGDLPQLPLEALILKSGGFEGLAPMEACALGYWVMSGGREAGGVKMLEDGVGDLLQDTEEALQNLVRVFDDGDVPYLSLPRSDKLPRFNDYLHLARVQEWAALDDEEAA